MQEKWGRVVYSIIEFINSLFRKENNDPMVLDDRFEFRLNKKEKILIKKYCELKRISVSEFFRNLAMKEINNFLNVNVKEIDKLIYINKESQYKIRQR